MSVDSSSMAGLIEAGSLKIDNKLGEVILIAGVAYSLYGFGRFLYEKMKVDVNANIDVNVDSESMKAIKDFMQ